jgi:type IV pilus assembly protein PilN
MTTINLLPWREQLRKERQQRFVAALGTGVVAALAIVAIVHIQFMTMIDNQSTRNAFVQQQIERVEKQIKEIERIEAEKRRLLARMNVIQQLQQGRPQIVHVLDELVKTLPEGVYLTNIKQVGQGLDIQGFAQSNARISAYMRNLDASPWLANPKLSVIEAAGTSEVTSRNSKFTLNVTLEHTEEAASASTAGK